MGCRVSDGALKATHKDELVRHVHGHDVAALEVLREQVVGEAARLQLGLAPGDLLAVADVRDILLVRCAGERLRTFGRLRAVASNE